MGDALQLVFAAFGREALLTVLVILFACACLRVNRNVRKSVEDAGRMYAHHREVSRGSNITTFSRRDTWSVVSWSFDQFFEDEATGKSRGRATHHANVGAMQSRADEAARVGDRWVLVELLLCFAMMATFPSLGEWWSIVAPLALVVVASSCWRLHHIDLTPKPQRRSMRDIAAGAEEPRRFDV